MKATRYDTLLAAVRLACQSTPRDAIALIALQQAGARFCRESKAWRQNMPAITPVADQLSYAITNDWAADIVRVHRVGLRTAAEITADADADGTEIHPSRYIYIPQTGKIKFEDGALEGSTVASAVLLNAILVPQLFCSEIAAWFLNLYRDGIIAGAAADICSQPQPAFYNAGQARAMQVIFDNEVQRAYRDAESNWTEQPQQVTAGFAIL